MKALTLALASLLAVLASGCGSDSTSKITPAALTFVQRQTSNDDGQSVLYTLNPKTAVPTAVPITIDPDAEEVSPNSSATAVVYDYEDSNTTRDIFYMGSDSQEVALTTGGIDWEPVFSPDGKTIAYQNCAGADCTIYTMGADGSNQQAVFATAGYGQDYPWFSPDGTTLSFFLYCDTCSCNGCDDDLTAPSHGPGVQGTLRRRRHHQPQHATRNAAGPLATSYVTGWYTMTLASPSPTLVYATSEDWGPSTFTADGGKLLMSIGQLTQYWNIYSISLDGSGLAPLTASLDADEVSPVEFQGQIWFNRYDTADGVWDFYSMSPEGSAQTLVLASSPTNYEFLVDSYYWDW